MRYLKKLADRLSPNKTHQKFEEWSKLPFPIKCLVFYHALPCLDSNNHFIWRESFFTYSSLSKEFLSISRCETLMQMILSDGQIPPLFTVRITGENLIDSWGNYLIINRNGIYSIIDNNYKKIAEVLKPICVEEYLILIYEEITYIYKDSFSNLFYKGGPLPIGTFISTEIGLLISSDMLYIVESTGIRVLLNGTNKYMSMGYKGIYLSKRNDMIPWREVCENNFWIIRQSVDYEANYLRWISRAQGEVLIDLTYFVYKVGYRDLNMNIGITPPPSGIDWMVTYDESIYDFLGNEILRIKNTKILAITRAKKGYYVYVSPKS